MMSLSFHLLNGGLGMLNDNYIAFSYHEGHFPLSNDGKAADIYVSEHDYEGVIRAVSDLQQDVYKVTQTNPQIFHQTENLKNSTVIIGTIGQSGLIDKLIAEGKLE